MSSVYGLFRLNLVNKGKAITKLHKFHFHNLVPLFLSQPFTEHPLWQATTCMSHFMELTRKLINSNGAHRQAHTLQLQKLRKGSKKCLH